MRPYFALSNGKVTLDDSFLNSREYRGGLTLPHRIVGRLIANSRVFQVIHRVLEAAREGKTGSRSTGIEEGLDAEVFAPPANPKWVDAWDVTDKLIEEMNDEVKEHRAIFLIVTLTSSIQVNPDCPARAALEKRLQVADLLYPDRRISALGRRDGFEVLNLPQPFLDYAQRNHVYLHGFRNTAMGAGHWNEDGHRLAGQLVAERVCEILQHEAPDSSPLAAPH